MSVKMMDEYALPEHEDPSRYAAEMALSASDKERLLSRIPHDVRVVCDFGTAVGGSLKTLRAKYDSVSNDNSPILVGYDIDPALIEEAKKDSSEGIIFTSSYEEAERIIRENTPSAMVISSVIHETVIPGRPDAQDQFWGRINTSGINTMLIRDFHFDPSNDNAEANSRLVKCIRQMYQGLVFNDTHPLAGKEVLDVWENGFSAIDKPDTVHPFFNESFAGWGSIDGLKSFIHFMLTFDLLGEEATDLDEQILGIRELREDFTSVSRQLVLERIDTKRYRETFHELYQDEYRREVIEEQLGIHPQELPDYKMQLIFEAN